MKPAPSYLTRNRHGTFYFRMVIPAPLRPLVNGKREVRRSLKTDSERLALKRARQHAVRFESVFDRVLAVSARNDDETSASELEFLEMLEFQTSGGYGSPPESNAEPEPVLTDAESVERQRRQCIAELLEGGHDRPIRPELEPFADELLAHARTYKPTELPRELPRLRDDLVRASLTRAGAVVVAEPAPAPASGLRPEASQWTLYDVWQEELRQAHELKDTQSGGPANNEGTRKDCDRKARCATILTNHKPVGTLTKDDLRQAYRNACKLKRDATASVESGSLTTLEELTTSDREELASTETINGLITALKRQHNFARLNDLTSIPVDAISYKKLERRSDEEDEAAKPFSDDDLNKIFSGYTFVGAPAKGVRVYYPFHYWLPLLGYFTGARANELAQLDTADITQELIDSERGKSKELVWCINFREDPPGTAERKRIKTGEDRIVPIHPRLIELGFLDYVEAQRKAGQKKLYGDGLSYAEPGEGAENNKEGWLKNAGRHFNCIPSETRGKGESKKGYFWRVGVHAEADDGKTLYSFRKTLTTALNDAIRDGASIAESTVQTIIGHVPTTVMGKNYDQRATPRQMLAALGHMPIPQAIHDLKGYKVDYVMRLGGRLDKSVKDWRDGKGRAPRGKKMQAASEPAEA